MILFNSDIFLLNITLSLGITPGDSLHCVYGISSNTTFIFDFSTCQGKAEDAILALASIEKVFRFYRAETPKLTDRVKIDKELDEFLRIHFMQYSIWCSSRKETKEDPTHVYYLGILEDKQFDDLTLFAIKKN